MQVELEVEAGVQQPGDVLGPLQVAAHPEQASATRLSMAEPQIWSVPGVVQIRGYRSAARPAPRCPCCPPPCELLTTRLPARQGHARQAAGHDRDLLAAQDERPQVDVPAFAAGRRRTSGACESWIVGWAM